LGYVFLRGPKGRGEKLPAAGGFFEHTPLVTGLPVLKMKIEGVGAEFLRDHFAHFNPGASNIQ
jgi:hypothetical protein